MRLLSIPQASERLSLAEATIRDKRWRFRVRLPLTRIGRRVGVLEADLQALLRRSREKMCN